jgi:large repetitive protein
MKRPSMGRRLAALAATATLVLAGAAVASADDVYNTIDNSVDNAAETMPLTLGGATGQTNLRVDPRNGDATNPSSGNTNGCNFDFPQPGVSTPSLVVNLVSSNPGVATVAPSSVTFTSCTDIKPIVVTAHSAGSAQITLVTVSNTTRGDFDLRTATFNVAVTAPANTPPTLSLPSDITAEATGPGGAVVGFSATATDTQDGPITPACSPDSGGTFPLGTTTVNCSVTDLGGLTTTGSFTVTVVDTTAPIVTVPADIIEEATGPSGAIVSFNASASDIVDGPITANCIPASGGTFSLGTTTVTCTATDASGNTGSDSFDVTVRDTTGPTVTVPADIVVNPTSTAGAIVTFTSSANDLVDGALTPSCTPPSGSLFATGTTTTVECTATDSAGNTGEKSFTVTVRNYLSGFYRPVEMGAVNTVKAGSTVPLKFEVFGTTEITDTGVVKSFSTKTVACEAFHGVATDEVDFTTTGKTALRYDTAEGHFIQNWQTPKTANTCLVVTMTMHDGQTMSANFKLK